VAFIENARQIIANIRLSFITISRPLFPQTIIPKAIRFGAEKLKELTCNVDNKHLADDRIF
jgi:2,4-dienoyl-CoA reductase-like NADH-dependent reductase (Old Yellow Enzyme family)